MNGLHPVFFFSKRDGRAFLATATGILLLLACCPIWAAKIAIVSAGSEVEKFGDLLTATLSPLTNVTLVERAQIQKVIQEQSLALTQPQSFVKAGRLLGAEGLILLERRLSQQTNEVLSVRLVAINPGVVILEQQFNLPLSNLPDWASLNSLRIQRVLPKLSVKLEDAVPVSIGSLRSSVATGDGVALESELSALLRLRLAQEPSVFVLERRGMEALQTEKELGAVEEPFWNGAVVVDGTINRDLVSRTNITIHARLAAPNRPAAELIASGSRESLTALISELTAKILASLGKKEALPVWLTEAEAEQFLQEAQWAAKWGLWPEVANHSDAAWALGKRTPLVGAYRVTARVWRCLGMRGPANYDYVGPYGFRSPPHPEVLPLLARTTEIYRELFPQFAFATNATRTGWASLGLDLLLVNARVLDCFQERPELCERRDNELREVRALARDVNTLLLTNAGLGLSGWRRDLQGLPTVHSHIKSPVSTLGDAWIDAGGVWFERPIDALPLYRKLLDAGGYRKSRGDVFGHFDPFGTSVPLAAWSYRDRVQLQSLWCDFAREMTTSTNLQVRLDGWRLILVHSTEPSALENAAEQMLEEAARSRVVVFNEFLDAPVSTLLSNTLRRINTWGIPQTEQRLERLHASSLTRLDEKDPELSYAIWKNFVADVTNANSLSAGFRRVPSPPSPERISELIAELETIEREKRTKWGVRPYIEQLRSYAPAIAVTDQATVAPINNNSRTRGSKLNFSQIWHLENAHWPPDQNPNPAIYRQPLLKASWQEGNLWLEVQTHRTDHQGARPRLAAVRLNPLTMQSEVIIAPFESFGVPVNYQRHVLVVSNELFLANGGVLWHRNTSGVWTKSPLPTDGGGVLHRWGKHIALSAAGSILDFAPETGDVRILASVRRNPPASSLDRRSLNGVPLGVWPDNTLCAAVEGQLWRYDAATNDWRVFASATNCGQSIEVQSQGVFLRQTAESSIRVSPQVSTMVNCGPQLLGGWRPNRTKLDYYTWAPARRQAPTQAELFTPPRWQYPTGAFPHDCQAQFDGANVWVFPSPFANSHFEVDLPVIGQFGRQVSARTNYIPTTILFLDASRNETIELGIQFTGPAREFAEAYEQEHAQGRDHVEFIHTEMGLAIVALAEGIIFWAPKAELDTAVTAARNRALPGYSLQDEGQDRFDKDGKGWLDDAEDRARRHDPAWRKQHAERIEAAIKSAVSKHGAAWDKNFAEADKNHDGKLTGVELDSAAKEHPEVFIHRLQGLNGGATQVMRPFNVDNDLGLDQKEFRMFLAEPRLLSELNRSADWVTRLGLKPEQCDTNDDGTLDAKERAQLLRLVRERQAPKR
jgi:hypothetical protein